MNYHDCFSSDCIIYKSHGENTGEFHLIASKSWGLAQDSTS